MQAPNCINTKLLNKAALLFLSLAVSSLATAADKTDAVDNGKRTVNQHSVSSQLLIRANSKHSSQTEKRCLLNKRLPQQNRTVLVSNQQA